MASRMCLILQVDQPDPSQAGKVAYYLEGAGNVLPEKVTTGGGTQIQRKIEVLHPKKKVIVPGRKSVLLATALLAASAIVTALQRFCSETNRPYTLRAASYSVHTP